MPIIWRKAMSVGNDLIDHDHHFMINFINTIELILQTPDEKDMLLEVIDQLHEYAVNHFRREESIQRKINFPHSLKHRNSHTNLLNQLKELRSEIGGMNNREEITARSAHVIDFLRNWLINHVLSEDMLLKPYLEKHPRGFS